MFSLIDFALPVGSERAGACTSLSVTAPTPNCLAHSKPRTARRSNQSILKNINPEHSLEGLMLKLKLQHFGHLM